MQVARAIRLLSLPAAVGLGTALAVACSGGTPTSPDQVFFFNDTATTETTYVDDLGDPTLGNKDCPGGYTLISATGTIGVDINTNDFVCAKNGGNGSGGKKK